jgi:uncharacterized protein YhaN
MPDHISPYVNESAAVRLSVLETNMHTVQITLNEMKEESATHRELHSKQTDKIYSSMEEIKNELGKDINDLRGEIDGKLGVLKLGIDNKFDSLSKKIDQLERWRWIIIGGAAAVGFFFTEVGRVILKAFTN